ncbi:hypothetical protein H5V45_05835 [Nocardioides sp. KIGAM211]|uniref:DUF222 domain-containing protein n=1 Tax=Nocardioides luti TaxID=2761101 RepID=A0A7X0REI7_9ACTN|nr:hypothetical protein [Nocardioides luti]MBB6626836.1 hypothetical protein [Nocardioides luti]
MAIDLVTELDPGQTLRGLELMVVRRRAVEVDELMLVARWCELQSTDPRDDPRPHPERPLPPGSDRLVRLGGVGTPSVRELTLAELGIARGVHVLSARAVAADVLDLRFRLPRVWEVFLGGGCDAWVARKVASMSRKLSPEGAALVDAAIAPVIGSEAPGRVLTIAEAKVVEADVAAHEEAVTAEKRRRYVSLTRTDEHGLRTVIARIGAGDAAYVDAVVTRVADILATRPEHTDTTRDVLRALAFGWLARPAELLTLLLEHTDAPAEDPAEPEEPADPEEDPGVPARALAFPADLLPALRAVDPKQLRPKTVLYVHLHEAALTGTPAVARVEGIGPHTLTQVKDLLTDTDVVVKPVIDLTDRVSVNCYEHPTRIAERVHLEQPGDTFPHARTISRNLDLDHRRAYRAQGPPGQTGLDTSQPLGRTAHRAKTHLGYQVTPVPGGGTLWRTPHGLVRVTDRRGTHWITASDAAALTGPDPLQRVLVQLMIEHRVRPLPH